MNVNQRKQRGELLPDPQIQLKPLQGGRLLPVDSRLLTSKRLDTREPATHRASPCRAALTRDGQQIAC